MYSQRLNEMYSNMNHPNINNQIGMYNQFSQMTQHQPQSYYQSQFVVPTAYPTNNFTQDTNSQLDENNPNSFSQMVKNNLETILKKVPENVSTKLVEKMNGKLQKSNEEILSFKKKLKESNNRVEKELGKIPNCLQLIERELDEINSKLIEFKELISKNRESLDNQLKRNQNEFLDQISKNRDYEKKLLEYVDQIEIMKLDISQSINYSQSELNKILKLKDDSLEEIKIVLHDKFNELSKEISEINSAKFSNSDLKSTNEIKVDSSVKKINELKKFINKFQKNNRIKEINKENFSLLANKENNRNSNNINISGEDKLELNFSYHRKVKNSDFSFYQI